MAEPILFADAAEHLRLAGDTSEQTLVDSYIVAAREFVENYTGRVLVQRAFTETFDSFGTYLELLRRPFVSVDEIAYTDSDGVAGTVATFAVMMGAWPIRIYPAYGESWPAIRSNTEISVTYTAGYTATEEPQALLQAMFLLIGHWFSTRAGVNVGNIANEVPLAVAALCDQHRAPGV